jgi:TetR/AcrR family transcriptional regulator, transcriptional repressor for nem operon
MTDSDLGHRGGKRERLVSAAGDLLHRQGVEATTLAEIAETAQVPPGNVYYYFKTRDDLIAAVIESRATELADLLKSLEQWPSPAVRLRSLARAWGDQSNRVAAHGCPVGSLAAELNKRDRGLDEQAARLLATLIEWARSQFHQMGRPDAQDLAVTLICGVQGAALLANSLRDPGLLSSQVRRLEGWIDSLDR